MLIPNRVWLHRALCKPYSGPILHNLLYWLGKWLTKLSDTKPPTQPTKCMSQTTRHPRRHTYMLGAVKVS